MLNNKVCSFIILFVLPAAAFAEKAKVMPTASERPSHHESAKEYVGIGRLNEIDSPPIPEGMTLKEVLSYANGAPPPNFPQVIHDNDFYLFTLFEQLEYRIPDDSSPDILGWEAQGWYGPDYHKFWWKSEGESVFDGSEEGESENDFLYSRFISPFWSIQAGAQYANEWTTSSYEDRWSGVLALQGLAPYKFEIDNSIYVSEDADVTLSTEAEYNIRITQRLVMQPRAEFGLSAQDIEDRKLGVGLTDGNIDVRLRYEIVRELAPYFGVRYRFLAGETKDFAKADGENSEQWLFLAGLRFAF